MGSIFLLFSSTSLAFIGDYNDYFSGDCLGDLSFLGLCNYGSCYTGRSGLRGVFSGLLTSSFALVGALYLMTVLAVALDFYFLGFSCLGKLMVTLSYF
jgi:hypothetical protein